MKFFCRFTFTGLIIFHAIFSPGFSEAQNSFTGVGTFNFLGPNVNEVIISGNTAFARRANSVDIIDLTDPSRPSLLSTTDFQAPSVSGIAVSANRLFVIFGNNFQIFDVSNLSRPSSLALVAGLAATATGIAVSGDRAFVGFANNVRVFDISNPASPSTLVTLSFALGGDVGEIDVSDGVAAARLSNVSPNRLEIIRAAAVAATTGIISGRVTSATTAEAIGGARVSIEPAGAAVLSDLGGSYISGALQPGAYNVSVSFPGFQTGRREGVQVAAGATVSVDFQLAPSTGTITGRITNSATGAPVSGASVSADPSGVSAAADANGIYTLTGLAPSQYTLAASAANFIRSALEGVALDAGGSIIADLSLRPSAGAVSGRVVDSSSGLAIAGATVLAGPGDLRATANANGNYIIEGLAEGPFSLRASSPSFVAQSRSDVAVRGGEVTVADFSLSPEPGSISGRVVDALTSQAISGAAITIEALGLSARSDENGDFSLESVNPGLASISASAEGFLSMSEDALVRAGRQARVDFSLERAIAGGPIIARAGFGLSPLTFSSAAGGAVTIVATVLGGMGELDVEAFLRLTDEDGRPLDFPLGRLERRAAGNFELSFEDLPPGTLPAGEFEGVRIVATDAEANRATWPSLNVPQRAP